MQFQLFLQASGASSGSVYQIVFLALIFGVMYFFMIRPQQKKAKDTKKFIESVSLGDKVVTIGGLHGTVKSKTDLTITLEVDRGVQLTFDKAAVSYESTKRVNPEKVSAEKATTEKKA